MSFIGRLESIGKGFEKGLSWAVQYAIPVEKLVALLFPQTAAIGTTAVDAVTLIQNAVLQVEQKYAASGVQNGSGAQKSAEVLTLAGNAVVALLKQAGISTADTAYVSSLVNVVVGILNVTPAATA